MRTLAVVTIWVQLLTLPNPVAGQESATLERVDLAGTGIVLDPGDEFGGEIVVIGDLDGDGLAEIAVGAPGDDDWLSGSGAVWILFLDADGKIRDHSKITGSAADLGDHLNGDDELGEGLAAVGDVDGDGIPDLVVGAPKADAYPSSSGVEQGGRWLLLMASDGTVRESHLLPAVGTIAPNGGRNGQTMTSMGDVNGDGVEDLFWAPSSELGLCAVKFGFTLLGPKGSLPDGSTWGDAPFFIRGMPLNVGRCVGGVVPVELNGDGVLDVLLVLSGFESEASIAQAVTTTRPGLTDWRLADLAGIGIGAAVEREDGFGSSVALVGDLDGNGRKDIVVGADGSGVRTGGGTLEPRLGAVFLFLRDTEGTPVLWRRWQGGEPGDQFGSGLAAWQTSPGVVERLLVGARGTDGLAGGLWWLRDAAMPGPAVVRTEAPDRLRQNEAAEISVTVRAASDAVGARLAFRRAGDKAFFSTAMIGSGGSLAASIPAFVIGDRSIDYWLEIGGAGGSLTRWPTQGHRSLRVLVADGRDSDVPSGTSAADFRLRSVPGVLAFGSIDSLLVDDLGPIDPTSWRAFGQGASGAIVDAGSQPLEVNPGRAFWLLARNAGLRFDTGPFTSVGSANPFEVSLPPGWNLIGNPYTFDLPSSAVSADFEPLDVRGYDGVWSTHSGDYVPFEGYAVYNPTGDFASIYFDPQGGTSQADPASHPELAFRIRASRGGVRDTDNVGLVLSMANAGNDPYDRPSPPVVGDYLSVAFRGESDLLSTDARPPGSSWPVEILSATSGVVTVEVEMANGQAAYLVDTESNSTYDAASPFRLAVEGGVPVSMELRLGKAPESVVGSSPTLDAVFPNPSDGPITVQFTLERAGAVSLELFDALGRQVLVRRMGRLHAGTHTQVLEPPGIAAGTYVLRFSADGLLSHDTLVLLGK